MPRRKVCFSFKLQALAPKVWCLRQQRNMSKFRERWRWTRGIFFHVVLLDALVWMCGSFAEMCGEANKSSRKRASRKSILSEDLTRAAELQVGSTVCRVHQNETRRRNGLRSFRSNQLSDRSIT